MAKERDVQLDILLLNTEKFKDDPYIGRQIIEVLWTGNIEAIYERSLLTFLSILMPLFTYNPTDEVISTKAIDTLFYLVSTKHIKPTTEIMIRRKQWFEVVFKTLSNYVENFTMVYRAATVILQITNLDERALCNWDKNMNIHVKKAWHVYVISKRMEKHPHYNILRKRLIKLLKFTENVNLDDNCLFNKPAFTIDKFAPVFYLYDAQIFVPNENELHTLLIDFTSEPVEWTEEKAHEFAKLFLSSNFSILKKAIEFFEQEQKGLLFALEANVISFLVSIMEYRGHIMEIAEVVLRILKSILENYDAEFGNLKMSLSLSDFNFTLYLRNLLEAPSFNTELVKLALFFLGEFSPFSEDKCSVEYWSLLFKHLEEKYRKNTEILDLVRSVSVKYTASIK